MPTLALSSTLHLALDAVTETFAIVAMRGKGKTHTATVLVEELRKHDLQTVVIDPTGVFWGLRSSKDGKSAGIPIFVLGGEHGDLPLEPTAGEVTANFVVETGMSCVLDFSEMSKSKMRSFVTTFAERLYFLKRQATHRTPLHVVIDEADLLAPQRMIHGMESLIGAVSDLTLRGRSRGLGVTVITQRPAKINKDVLSQCGVLIAMGMAGDKDRRAVADWISERADEGDKKSTLLESLPRLPRGDAWVWWPAEDIFKRVTMRDRATFDSSFTPKVGEVLKAPKNRAAVDLDALRLAMAATVDKIKADDPRALKARIRELEARGHEVDPTAVGRITELEEDNDRLRRFVTRSATTVSAVRLEGKALFERLDEAVLEQWEKTVAETGRKPKPQDAAVGVATREVRTARRAPGVYDIMPKDSNLGGARAILRLAAMYYPEAVSAPRLRTLAGIAARTYTNYLSKLRTSGLVTSDGNGVVATQAGVDYLNGDVPARPATTAEILEMWRPKLGGAYHLLAFLVKRMSAWSTRSDQICSSQESQKVCGIAPRTYTNYASKLVTNGLAIREGGGLRASTTLFPRQPPGAST